MLCHILISTCHFHDGDGRKGNDIVKLLLLYLVYGFPPYNESTCSSSIRRALWAMLPWGIITNGLSPTSWNLGVLHYHDNSVAQIHRIHKINDTLIVFWPNLYYS